MQHAILTMANILVRQAPEAEAVIHTGAGAPFHGSAEERLSLSVFPCALGRTKSRKAVGGSPTWATHVHSPHPLRRRPGYPSNI